MGNRQKPGDSIRVLVADDHEVVRFGLVRLLQDARDIDVVGEAHSGRQVVTLAESLRPDVVLMDVRMPGMSGMETTRRVLAVCPECAVLALSAHGADPFPARLLRVGALGYIARSASFAELVAAIRSVHAGSRYIAPQVEPGAVESDPDQDSESPFSRLSSRERQICLLVAQGERVQRISSKLDLSPKTVNTYRYRIFEKLRVDTDVELAMLALCHGMVELPDPGGL